MNCGDVSHHSGEVGGGLNVRTEEAGESPTGQLHNIIIRAQISFEMILGKMSLQILHISLRLLAQLASQHLPGDLDLFIHSLGLQCDQIVLAPSSYHSSTLLSPTPALLALVCVEEGEVVVIADLLSW